MATKFKIVALGDFLEITPSGAMGYDKLYGLQKQFWGWRCLLCGGQVILEGWQLTRVGYY